MPRKPCDPDRVRRNFLRTYGRYAMAWLVGQFEADANMAQIAREFAAYNQGEPVSRERVRQWRATFGRRITIYQTHESIAKMLDPGVDIG
jgi:hypothetical protein